MVLPWVWMNYANSELAELKQRGVELNKMRKEARILNSKASEDSLGNMTLLLLGSLEYYESAKYWPTFKEAQGMRGITQGK